MKYTRREFLRSVPLAGGAVALLPALGGGVAVLRSQSAMRALPASVNAGADARAALVPVLSFHLDQPWVDATGYSEAYHPPAGARGGEPLSLLDEETLSRFYGLI